MGGGYNRSDRGVEPASAAGGWNALRRREARRWGVRRNRWGILVATFAWIGSAVAIAGSTPGGDPGVGGAPGDPGTGGQPGDDGANFGGAGGAGGAGGPAVSAVTRIVGNDAWAVATAQAFSDGQAAGHGADVTASQWVGDGGGGGGGGGGAGGYVAYATCGADTSAPGDAAAYAYGGKGGDGGRGGRGGDGGSVYPEWDDGSGKHGEVGGPGFGGASGDPGACYPTSDPGGATMPIPGVSGGSGGSGVPGSVHFSH